MIKKLVKHGNSWALILDKPILELLQLSPTVELELSIDGNVLHVSAAREGNGRSEFAEALSFTLQNYDSALRELAK